MAKSAKASAETLLDRLGPCHSGPAPVMLIGKADIWAGANDEVNSPIEDWDIMVALLEFDFDTHWPSLPYRFNNAAAEVLPEHLAKRTETPWLALDWADGSIPAIHRDWWIDFVKWAREFDGAIAFYCKGGHGRTGTALAILATLSGQLDADECPVSWVREHYCGEAVETWSQIQYIEHVTGLPVRCHPAWIWETGRGLVHHSQQAAPAPKKKGGKAKGKGKK